MRRIMLAVLVVLASVGVFTVFIRDDSGSEPQTVRTAQSAVLISGSNSDAMDALIEGSLIDQNGCLGIDDGTGTVLVAVFPARTTVVSVDPLRVRLEGEEVDEGVFGIGDRVSLGGGVVRWNPSEYPLPSDAPQVCASGDIYFLNS